jgi:colanic acid/amylovoran biosynthesis glycosyltransferase
MSGLKVAYIAPELGALTSTFIYRECDALRNRGIEILTFSTIRPRDAQVSDEARRVVAETVYLYDAGPVGAINGALRFFLRFPIRFLSATGTLLRDMVWSEAPSLTHRAKMVWHFLIGCILAQRLSEEHVDHLHAHFAHVPAAVAMYAGRLSGVPFSFTAHANDIFERPTALKEKTARCRFAVCVSDFNRRYLAGRGCRADRLLVIHCGIDVDRYPFRERMSNTKLPLILSVGRFVEKKGFRVLIEALALLKSWETPFRCRIAGDGPLFESILQQVGGLGLSKEVELLGARPQEDVKELMAAADMFVLPCVIARSGDRDGIPVALMEAMALGAPVISTRLSGIPELVHDNENGLLTQPGDARSLAEAMQRLIAEPETAARFARAARETIVKEFDLNLNADRLIDALQGVTAG